MAAPMRSSSQEAGHRPRVADTRSTTSSSSNTTAKQDSQTSTTTTTTTTTTSTAAATATPATATNFEYDDNEWDIGIGDLIIDLDADIEKTNEAGTVMATNAATAGSAKAAAKMAIEHSATVDKGLKMKIKRTKPGTKTSEAKHEIVKSNEQNGVADAADVKAAGVNKHLGQNADKKYGCVATTPGANAATPTQNSSGPNTSATTPTPPAAATNNKRGSSGHRRDKAREKHSSSSSSSSSSTDKQLPTSTQPPTQPTLQQPPSSPKVASPVTVSELNGVVRGGVVPSQTAGLQRPVYPASTGPGPPQGTQGTPASPAAATGSAAKPEIAKGSAGGTGQGAAAVGGGDDGSAGSPPPAKKIKSEPKDVADVCVGTSVGTITEPDCLGPCEPGTSVTLEGIVWHETEGGVLVVNVTWRGKTYVGTLLDCTRHDWAPPRFCDSPTSDLDTRTPKGRETRSSVHSKLRNGGIKGRRGATNNGPGPSTGPSSPTPFVPPRSTDTTGNKRKVRTGEEEQPSPAANGKKTKVLTPVATPCASPPPSPVLLECPEPNCSKKYKHINGLKYHQSHAHGSADDEDTKDVTSMSENDESNIEAPSPATPVKSPEKSQDSPAPVKKREEAEMPLLLRGSALLEVPGNGSQPSTPVSTPPSPATPQSLLQDISGSPTVATVDSKNLVKPGILRYGTSNEEFPIGVFAGSKPQVQPTVVTPEPAPQPEPSFTNQLQSQIPQQFTQPPTLLIPAQSAPAPQPLSPLGAQSPKFKVKPAAALMPDDKKDRNGKVVGGFKKNKSRKSPGGSPNPPQAEQAVFGGIEQPQGGGRDEVQSPAYSDISDDGAPVVMDGDLEGKGKVGDKKGGDGMQHMPQYGIYPFYGQSPYLEKQEKQVVEKPVEKEGKKEDYPGKMMQHYVPYGYMSGYAYNLDYGSQLVEDSKVKEERGKEDASSSPGGEHVKAITPIPNPIQVPTPNKIIKTEKDKHQNENHQILKESIEMKNQMNNYMYQRQQQQQSHLSQREEDVRRFYVYSERRKEQQQQQQQQQNQENNKNHNSNKNPPPQSPNLKHKEKLEEKDKKDNIKQEGVKPTMETQGPPPPPTSQYAYIHPTYMQSPHYGPLPFDPNHPMYRGIMVPGPYSGNPYLHPQLPRYHAPEDLSRAPPPPTKALDMLQHHAQYYSSHKIHELQERALKSPTPKTSIASSSPSAVPGTQTGQVVTQLSAATSQANSTTATGGGKQTAGETKDNRSPPPQRHVHTHHHTHVGLGYPMYPAPYGAAVLASQQAAAVTVINPYPPK